MRCGFVVGGGPSCGELSECESQEEVAVGAWLGGFRGLVVEACIAGVGGVLLHVFLSCWGWCDKALAE